MCLLSNIELAKHIFENDEIIIPAEDGDKHFERELLQPASIDITVGEIFIPPNADDDRKEVISFTNHFTLGVGSAVLIRSEQKFKLPPRIGGFVFPKNGHFALKGILITNFGHIDPGFEGHLKFTVINMGRETFDLEAGLPIASVVLFNLTSPANPSWQPRHDADDYAGQARRLPRVFMDFETTANRVARDQVRAEWRARERLSFWATLATSIMATVIAMALFIWGIIYPFVQTSYDKLIATNIEIGKLQTQINELKSKTP
jgi:deoxycytidine triphosphate deaminase